LIHDSLRILGFILLVTIWAMTSLSQAGWAQTRLPSKAQKELSSQELSKMETQISSLRGGLETVQRRLSELESRPINAKGAIKNPKQALLYQELGKSYIQAKRFNRAIEAYTQSLEYDASDPNVYYYLGLLYHQIDENTDRSVQNFNRFLALSKARVDLKNRREEVEYLLQIFKDKPFGAK
jgi:tetratricopeptide (TPR) repeat protein